MSNWFERAIIVRKSKIWQRIKHKLPAMGDGDVIKMRAAAIELRRVLDGFIREADHQISRVRFKRPGFQKPENADWAWQPELWSRRIEQQGVAPARSKTEVGQETRLFHDCETAAVTIKQFRNSRSLDLAPFGFMMDVFQFDGSFLSLAIALPQAAVEGLNPRHIFEVEAIIESERPVKILARLNIRQGPNVEQITREFPQSSILSSVGLDLGYLILSENRIQDLWLDLIFDAPQMNQIKIRDLTFYRRPRAEF